VIFSAPMAAQAAGFALIEQSASGMGNAFAGGGAVAEDASTIFFNPAGMTYISGTQIVGAIHLIKPSAEFNNNGSVAGAGAGPFPSRPLGGSGGDAGDLSFVPNFYYKRDLTDTVKFGLGVNAPFGLKTEYDKDWIGRFQAIKSELKTVNINPAIAFKLNDQLSIGAGLSAMWAQAELTSAVNLVASERTSKVQGDDWGFGFNL
ncbi:MAG: outer membrane protein transport protein, partial [Pseudomonadota bacterium]